MRELKEIIVGTKMEPSLVQKLEDEAQQHGVSRSTVVRWAVLKYFESEKVAIQP